MQLAGPSARVVPSCGLQANVSERPISGSSTSIAGVIIGFALTRSSGSMRTSRRSTPFTLVLQPIRLVMMPTLLVTFETDAAGRAVIQATIGAMASVVYLSDLRMEQRAEALAQATALLARNTAAELLAGEAALIGQARLIQFVTAGVDYIPLSSCRLTCQSLAMGAAMRSPWLSMP
jgi:hypothetical protein